MDSTLRNSTFSIGSDSSSVYSDDDLISETNSTGTQIHHRTHLQPTIGGMPRENGQNFELSSTSQLQQSDSTQNLDEFHASVLDTSHASGAPYRFETAEEAQERYRRGLASRALNSGVPLSNIDSDIPSRHQSFDFGRHSQGARMGSYPGRDVRDTILSTASAPSFCLTDAGELAEEYIRETGIRHNSLQPNMPATEPAVELTKSQTPRLRATSISQDPSDLDLTDSSPTTQQRYSHRNAALQALSSSVPNAIDRSEPAGPNHLDGSSQASAENLNITRRRGRVDWQNDPKTGPAHRASLYSTTGREYSLGDHTRGYTSGEYITTIGKIEEQTPPPEETRKKSLIKRLFCVA